jgi:hypothetical protein
MKPSVTLLVLLVRFALRSRRIIQHPAAVLFVLLRGLVAYKLLKKARYTSPQSRIARRVMSGSALDVVR